jgi:hypothetical protein
MGRWGDGEMESISIYQLSIINYLPANPYPLFTNSKVLRLSMIKTLKNNKGYNKLQWCY